MSSRMDDEDSVRGQANVLSSGVEKEADCAYDESASDPSHLPPASPMSTSPDLVHRTAAGPSVDGSSFHAVQAERASANALHSRHPVLQKSLTSQNARPPWNSPTSSNRTSAIGMLQAASQADLSSVSSALASQPQNPAYRSINDYTIPTIPTVNEAVPQSQSSASHALNAPNPHVSSSTSPQRPIPMAQSAISSAIQGAQLLASATKDRLPTRPPVSELTLAAHAQMAFIATHTAVEEAERQFRLQALLRANISLNTSGTSAASTEMSHKRVRTDEDTRTEALRQLRLGHITMPSRGFEQAWGRSDASGLGGDDDEDASLSRQADGRQQPARYFDAKDALAGVPSLPLMPAPPLAMVEPPSPRSFRTLFPAASPNSRPLQWPDAARAAPMGSRLDRSKSPTSGGIDVIQSQNGTMQAGRWVADSKRDRAMSGSSSVEVSSLSEQPAPQSSVSPTSYSTPSASQSGGSRFEPSYTFDGETYAALATQAAYATSVLTTALSPAASETGEATAATSAPSETESSSTFWSPLAPDQTEAIANQLCAWAGLQGPVEQERARESLNRRRQHLVATSASATAPSASAPADATSPSKAAFFFPPDFASHYQAQLQALTQGFYEQLHSEGLASRRPAAEDPLLSSPAASQSTTASSTESAQTTEQGAADSRLEEEVNARVATLGLPTKSIAAVVANAVAPPSPRPAAGARHPSRLLSAASTAAAAKQDSQAVLDQLLRFAHHLYQSGSQAVQRRDGSTATKLDPTLLPLLHTLHKMHPNHLPTLLLLSCAYYSLENHSASLYWNDRILSIDPQYVEAMSNIGTTLRAMGRCKEAESWWVRAVRLRPGYWDAYENLLGVLCSSRPSDSVLSGPAVSGVAKQTSDRQGGQTRWREALNLCEHVERHFFQDQSSKQRDEALGAQSGTATFLPETFPCANIPRLQQLFYVKGNLKYCLYGDNVQGAQEHMRAIEVVISASEAQTFRFRDLIVATSIIGLLSMGAALQQQAAAGGALQILQTLGIDVNDTQMMSAVASSQWSKLKPGGILALVRDAGERLVETLLRLGGGQLPMIMLEPESASQLAQHVFAETRGQLPSLAAAAIRQPDANVTKAIQQSNHTASNILLALAKQVQDATANPVTSKSGRLNIGGIPASISLVLPLYYLSLSLNPSASTYNNLGILLSGLPIITVVLDSAGRPTDRNGQAFAMEYYSRGLQLDPHHPHLYTNMGSLLKDLGYLKEAIAQYEKAIELSPTFVVALANLGNSLRDAGRTEEALPYYRRALQAPGASNAPMPQALCGLLNGLLHVADWDDAFSLSEPSKPGLLRQVAQLVEKQLDEGGLYGAGALSSSGTLESWCAQIFHCLGELRPGAQELWHAQLRQFFARGFDRQASKVNEGSFVIRLIEFLHRHMQRRWYHLTYGSNIQASRDQLPLPAWSSVKVAEYALQFPRLRLPSALVAPPVPTVLPFHTFSYGVEGIMSARAIRLISHRNAIRISQSTLTQPWLPPHVYPPPRPPAPRIKIGYVSSDLNNHPLAHLMQSCFGMHDPDRFEVFLYATAASDHSPYRQKIESEAHRFRDVSTWSSAQIINRILQDGIHILMNLNGYTKGARNDVFAARPCPIQMQFMGFAGGMVSGWTDYVVVDAIVCPPEVTSVEVAKARRAKRQQAGLTPIMPGRSTDLPGDLDPEEPSDGWLYTERFLYMPHSYFVNDHKQGFRRPQLSQQGGSPSVRAEKLWADEEQERWAARKELFPGLPDDFVIFASFNQIYKIEPTVFKAWLQILAQVPNSILWLLRFPASGEPNLIKTAREWAGDEVAARIVFTDVAPKDEHIRRGRIADLFLDTFEVNAHTTACDCLWSGTPILTWPKWIKQASLVAASIARASGYGDQMIVDSAEEYVHRAVTLARSVKYRFEDGKGVEVTGKDAKHPIMASELHRLGSSAVRASLAQAEAQSQAEAAQDKSLASTSSSGDQGSLVSAVTSDQHQDKRIAVARCKAAATIVSAVATSASASAPCSESVEGDVAAASTQPAPVNVSSAASKSASHMARLAEVCPDYDSVPLTVTGAQMGDGIAGVTRRCSGELSDLRRNLFLTREKSPLFDTQQWVRDLERGYEEAWRRWVTEEDGSREWEGDGGGAQGRHIWVAELAERDCKAQN